MTTHLPKTLAELTDILETQPPGTLLLVYNTLLDHPVVTQTFARRTAHWTTNIAGYDCIIVKSAEIANNILKSNRMLKFALMSWDDAQNIDVSLVPPD